MAKKQELSNEPDPRLQDAELWALVNDIQDLVKVRQALSFGTRTSIKDTAESVVSRAINAKVKILGETCIKKFDE